MNSASRRKRRRQWLLPCSRMRHGIGGQATYRRRRERRGRRSWERSRMHEPAVRERANNISFAPLRTTILFLFLGACLLPLLSCSQAPDPNTLVMIIESSPTNLDPRVGIDAQSERIDALIFDDLLDRDEHLNVTPALPERWETPDPLTYIFHIRRGVKFHDCRSLTSRDAKCALHTLVQGQTRTTRTPT